MTGRIVNNKDIDPDEIFLDSENLPDFDQQQFEGRIERPIKKRTVAVLGAFFAAVAVVFAWKLWILQIVNGAGFETRSANNSLKNIPFFAERGLIFDRNDKLIVKNIPDRTYPEAAGFSHVVGYIGYPTDAEIQSGKNFPDEMIGKAGVEKDFNAQLRGLNGLKIVETDARGKVYSESVYQPPASGESLYLSIDSDVQAKLFQIIKSLAKDKGFQGGSGVIMDVKTGELIALVSYPEYSSQIISEGKDVTKIKEYFTDENSPFLDRAIAGVYTPGSIVKPFMALAALTEKVITPEKQILSTGSISIPNPYYPDKKSVFLDWKAHGWVDVRKAIEVSSDVYFYAIGGGFESQKGIGIINIEKYATAFGFGTTTNIDLDGEAVGTIPSPEWKAAHFNGEKWLLGDTYHTVIGQYGFGVTLIQVARAFATIAENGLMPTPTILRATSSTSPKKIEDVQISDASFLVVKEGMRQSATVGTAAALNIPEVRVAAKTGTAELGITKKRVNSWVVGFFPYEKPRYSFAIVMEKGSRSNLVGASFAMRQLLDWMKVYAKEYLE